MASSNINNDNKKYQKPWHPPSWRNCRFYGSRKGCTRPYCRFKHTNPNSVKFCQYGDHCRWGEECMFRHVQHPRVKCGVITTSPGNYKLEIEISQPRIKSPQQQQQPPSQPQPQPQRDPWPYNIYRKLMYEIHLLFVSLYCHIIIGHIHPI